MCGICGIYGISDKKLIQRMMDSLIHRGPDDEGYLVDEYTSLGVRRLSIIDLEKGTQPIFNENGNICLIFNGEIYNFKELREDLVKLGHQFSTNSDTEVIVHAFEEYGKDCLSYFDGMFAFAIYIINEKKLFIARDKLGIKPLYFFKNKSFFAFASEIKALFKIKEIPKAIDNRSLLQFSVFKFLFETRTFFEYIWQLPAGSYCILTKEDFKIEKYWEPRINEVNFDIGSQIKLLEKNIINSVVSHLNADVPVTIALSGLDSNIIAAIASKFLDEVNTITISDNEDNGDVFYSKIVSDKLNFKHETFIIDGYDYFNKLPKIMFHSEDMLASNRHIIAEKAREKYKVVLFGDGADELFMGYPFFKKHDRWVTKRVAALNMAGDNNGVGILNNLRNIETFQENILKNELPGLHLIPLDKGCMQHSVEARVPYLSNAIIDQSLSMGSNIKIINGETKAILKKIALKYLPKFIVLRKKEAFPANLQSISRNINKICNELISDNYFNNHPLKRILKNKFNLLKYDILNEIFIKNNAEPKKNFSLENFY